MADRWFDTDFTVRKKLRFKNALTDPPGVTTFISDEPIPLFLTPAVFDLTRLNIALADDLRIINQGNLVDITAREIELLTGTSLAVVWAKLTEVNSFDESDHVYLYFHNEGVGTLPEPATSQAVWSNGFDAVWIFNTDPSGAPAQLIDSTGNGNDLDSAGAMTGGDLVDAQIGKGWDFDGVDDRAISNSYLDGSVFTKMTIEINFSRVLGVAGALVSRGIFGTSDWCVELLSDGTVQFRWRESGATVFTAISTTKITDTDFHYVAGVWEGASMKLYVDGVLEDTKTGLSGTIVGTAAGASFRIAEDSSGSNLFNGIIDWTAVSNVAKSSQVIEYRNLGIKGKFIEYGPDEVLDVFMPVPSFFPDLSVDKIVEKI